MTFGIVKHLKCDAMLRLLSVAVTLLLGFQGSSGAATHTASSLTLESLLTTLKENPSRRVKFHESHYMRALTRPLESEGELAFTPPSTLLKEVKSPRAITYRVEGDKVFIDDPQSSLKEVFSLSDTGVLEAFIEAIRAPLAGDLLTLQRFWEPHLGGSFKHWSLTLIPHDPSVKALVHRVTVKGQEGQILAMSIEEANGDSTQLIFKPQ